MKAGATKPTSLRRPTAICLARVDRGGVCEREPAQSRHDIADAILRLATLSPREREVLDGLLAGRSNKLIAYDLRISVRTV
jgi:two-component system response regulator FixJ